jgi:hypothetical protein
MFRDLREATECPTHLPTESIGSGRATKLKKPEGFCRYFQPGTPLGNGPGFATATNPQTIAVTSPGLFTLVRPSAAHDAALLWYSEHWSKEVW